MRSIIELGPKMPARFTRIGYNPDMLNLVAKLGFSIYPGEGETNMEPVVLRV